MQKCDPAEVRISDFCRSHICWFTILICILYIFARYIAQMYHIPFDGTNYVQLFKSYCIKTRKDM